VKNTTLKITINIGTDVQFSLKISTYLAALIKLVSQLVSE